MVFQTKPITFFTEPMLEQKQRKPLAPLIQFLRNIPPKVAAGEHRSIEGRLAPFGEKEAPSMQPYMSRKTLLPSKSIRMAKHFKDENKAVWIAA